VVAIEIDDRLIPVLAETLAGLKNVEVLKGDALSVDLGSFGATKLIANLPYNIAVPVVMRALETAPGVDEITVMTQREVGERLAAPPGSKVYGQPSVLAAYFADVSVVSSIGRGAFFPVPNVDSVLVRLSRRVPPPVDFGPLATVVRAAFSQRRKSIRNSLRSLLGPEADDRIASAGLDPAARPETMALPDFVALARLLASA
jgi:16S rRNA (adenine1518-N6/adenine1519-N6)-dimethyltransferase